MEPPRAESVRTYATRLPHAALSLASPPRSGRMASAVPATSGPRPFRAIVHSGAPVTRPGYTEALDLGGVAVPERKIPVLLEGDPTKRAGFSERAGRTKEGALAVEGRILDNATGRAILRDLAEGFPFQAGAIVVADAVDEVKAGHTATVNGHTLSGPAYIVTRSRLLAAVISACGEDGTSTVALARPAETPAPSRHAHPAPQSQPVVAFAAQASTPTQTMKETNVSNIPAATQHTRPRVPSDETLKAQWRSNSGGVADEFLSFEDYAAFARANARGSVGILERGARPR